MTRDELIAAGWREVAHSDGLRHPLDRAAQPFRDAGKWTYASDECVYTVTEASRIEELRVETAAYREAAARERELRKILPL
jgi:hypothetical protein